MNKMKKKLMASIAMLVISTILMTSTSYAWYTINTKATAGDINVTLAQTKNVEVAKAEVNATTKNFVVPSEVVAKEGTSQYTFGSSVKFELTAGETTKLDLPAKVPDTTTLTDIQALAYDDGDASTSTYPQAFAAGDVLGAVYSNTGRTEGLVQSAKSQDTTSGIVTYSYNYLIGNTTKTANIAFSYNMYVRTNIAGDIIVGYEKADGASDKATVSVKYAKIGVLTDKTTPGAGEVKEGADVTSVNLIGGTAIVDGADELSKWSDAKVKFSAEANTVYLVQVFCYFDGDGVDAADLTAKDLDATLKNLTFYNSAFYDSTNDEYPTSQGWEK